MAWKIIEIVAGFVIVGLTIADVFATVVVPGRVQVGLHIPRLVRFTVLPGWRRAARSLGRDGRGTVNSTFAAALLFGVFAAWVILVLLGFSLVTYGLRDSFVPPIPTFSEALFQTGSAMMTLGISGVGARGWARLPVVLAGLAGLQVITLTLTYIVQLQMALQGRDPLVLRLVCHAGSPPSGIELLATHRELRLERDLGQLFGRWEDWASELRQSHGAHPVLIYFRSGAPHADWVTALGAVMDAAALVVALIPDGPTGNAELLRRSGMAAIQQLADMLQLEATESEVEAETLDQGIARLRRAGFELIDGETERRAFLRIRGRHSGLIEALASYFGVEPPRLIPERG